MLKKQLLFPIALWTGLPPEHAVSCICKGHNYLFTGSFTGELCYWSVLHEHQEDRNDRSDRRQYVPRAMMMRDTMTAVTAMTRCYLDSEEICLAASYGGYLSSWSSKGGHSIKTKLALPFTAVLLQPYRFRISGRNYVVCSGNSSQVHIVTTSDMATVRVLRHQSKVVGTALTHLHNPKTPSSRRSSKRKTLFLLSLAFHGVLHFWDIDKRSRIYNKQKTTRENKEIGEINKDNKNRQSTDRDLPVKPTYTVRVGDMPSDPVGLAVSKDGVRFLIVMQRHWMICDLLSFRMEFLVDADVNTPNCGWSGCSFLSTNDRIALWTLDGNIHIYLLPPPFDMKMSHKRQKTSKRKQNSRPWLLATLDKSGEGRRSSKNRINQENATKGKSSFIPNVVEKKYRQQSPQTRPLENDTEQTMISGPCAVLVDGDDVFCGTVDGMLFHWSVPVVTFDDVPKGTGQDTLSKHPAQKRSFEFFQRLHAAHIMSISDGFNGNALLQHDVHNPCTSHVIFKDYNQIYLARGYQRGDIRVSNLLAVQDEQISFRGHTNQITSLVGISSSQSPIGKSLLISGSSDQTICVYTIHNAHLYMKFSCPNPVVSIHWPPPPETTLKSKQVVHGKATKKKKRRSDQKLSVTTENGVGNRRSKEMKKNSSSCYGDLLFVEGKDSALRIYSIIDKHIIQTLRGYNSRVKHVSRDKWCFVSDHVITQTMKGTIYLWELSSGALERRFEISHPTTASFMEARGLKCIGQNSFWLQQFRNRKNSDPEVSLQSKPQSQSQLQLSTSTSQSGTPLISTVKQQSQTISKPTKSKKADSTNKRSEVVNMVTVIPNDYLKHLHLGIFVININCLLRELLENYFNMRSSKLDNINETNGCSSSQYLMGLLAFLFDFGVDTVIDRLLSKNLDFSKPQPLHSFAITSDALYSQTVLLPCANENYGRWKLFDHMSAIHALSLTTVCMSLMSLLSGGAHHKPQPDSISKQQQYYSQIVAHYNVILPEDLPAYVEPMDRTLATFALNGNDEICTVARLLLQRVIERASVKKRKEMVKIWGKFYNYTLSSISSPIPSREETTSTKHNGSSVDFKEKTGIRQSKSPSTSPVKQNAVQKHKPYSNADKMLLLIKELTLKKSAVQKKLHKLQIEKKSTSKVREELISIQKQLLHATEQFELYKSQTHGQTPSKEKHELGKKGVNETKMGQGNARRKSSIGESAVMISSGDQDPSVSTRSLALVTSNSATSARNVSDEELMTCMVLCFIAIYNTSSSKSKNKGKTKGKKAKIKKIQHRKPQTIKKKPYYVILSQWEKGIMIEETDENHYEAVWDASMKWYSSVLFVSHDQKKTWQPVKEYGETAEKIKQQASQFLPKPNLLSSSSNHEDKIEVPKERNTNELRHLKKEAMNTMTNHAELKGKVRNIIKKYFNSDKNERKATITTTTSPIKSAISTPSSAITTTTPTATTATTAKTATAIETVTTMTTTITTATITTIAKIATTTTPTKRIATYAISTQNNHDHHHHHHHHHHTKTTATTTKTIDVENLSGWRHSLWESIKIKDDLLVGILLLEKEKNKEIIMANWIDEQTNKHLTLGSICKILIREHSSDLHERLVHLLERYPHDKHEKEEEEADTKPRYAADTLLRVISKKCVEDGDMIRCALAVDLLGKSFWLLRHHMGPDLVSVIRRIHHLSLKKDTPLAVPAHRALLQAGKGAPKHFVTCMGKEALSARQSPRARSSALMAIVDLVKKYPTAVAKVLPNAVQIITRCLDPSEPALRKSLLESSTKALHVLVQKYPMVTFHQDYQRFAVGTGKAKHSVIIIYDLRTATKWRILEGHEGNLSAVSFNNKGNCLVSYSAEESPPTIRAWNVDTSNNFIANLLGIQGKCTRVKLLPAITLPNGQGKPSLSQQIQIIKFRWKDPKTVKLTREDGSITTFKV